jgi:hypothetical protein
LLIIQIFDIHGVRAVAQISNVISRVLLEVIADIEFDENHHQFEILKSFHAHQTFTSIVEVSISSEKVTYIVSSLTHELFSSYLAQIITAHAPSLADAELASI